MKTMSIFNLMIMMIILSSLTIHSIHSSQSINSIHSNHSNHSNRSTQSSKPNFILILLDDAGWTDLGCYGSRIQTPHIDRLAKEGMRFTDCHSAAPNCSPSRAGLLTGKFPSRIGIYSYIPPGHEMHLRTEEITLPELLKQAGYATGHFGKWHLSQLLSDQPSPADHGFDHYFSTGNNADPTHHNPTNFIRNGKATGELKGYSCQLVVDEMIGWLREIQQKPNVPFFACLWFHEPHTPIGSPPSLIRKYQNLYSDLDKKQATYFANIENVDRAVGKLMKAIEQLGLDETMIFLTSDNGPLGDFSRRGLRGRKSNVYEGGHRVPGIFRWRGHISEGKVSSTTISGIDYLPTICEIANVPLPPDFKCDGTSLRPLLTNEFDELNKSDELDELNESDQSDESNESDELNELDQSDKSKESDELDQSDQLNESDEFARAIPLYWFFYRLNPSFAMRSENWSLIAYSNDASRPKTHPLIHADLSYIKASEPVRFELFDLANDLSQSHNLASDHPEILAKMKGEMQALHRSIINESFDWTIPKDYGTSRKSRVWNSERATPLP